MQCILSDDYLNIKGVEDNAFVNLASSKQGLWPRFTVQSHNGDISSVEIFCERGSMILNGLKPDLGAMETKCYH